ncbi:helix-turn-helix transcriptional regulator [Paenibacillus dauci]|uniref:helix-turn-helix transcriptional regulator n=1 Tax=Paenibacillus dauci TaxID=1567106 RepID=UPI00061979C1|nr:helix-turn-helix transcriptional regulator [Paenibacillus dauci]
MITNTTTIRLEIEKGIRQKGHSLSSFGKLAGINRGIISGILNGNPPKSISIRQLDLMAQALGHPEGWMYEYYVDECFINEKADWRRIKAFLLRCTEIGRYDCIQAVLDRLMEDLSNTVSVFGLAEELYEEGKVKESLPFYECVIENEKHQHSERLAIAHYRVFRASIGENTEQSLRAVIRFEPYRNRLPENMMLDALLQLGNIYYNFQDWNLLQNCADELQSLVKTVYKSESEKFKNTGIFPVLNTERELVVYYGQGYLIKATALEHLGRYEEAKNFILKYADLSDFQLLNDKGLQEVDKFKLYANANLNNLELLMGNTKGLDDYVNFIQENPKETLPSMLIIVNSANKHHFNIDHIIDQFHDIIYQKVAIDRNVYPVITSSRLMVLYHQLSIYYFHNNEYNKGIADILRSLALAVKVVNKNRILDCISLFEHFKPYASSGQKKIYETILKEVNNNEKSYDISSLNFSD